MASLPYNKSFSESSLSVKLCGAFHIDHLDKKQGSSQWNFFALPCRTEQTGQQSSLAL